MSKLRMALIFGGVSNEYKTSLLAAASIIDNIDTEEYETICIGITKKGRWLYYPGTSEDIRNDTWHENPDCTSVVISPDPNRKGIIKIEDGEVSVYRVDVIFPVLYGKNGEDGTIAGILRTSGIPFVGSDLMASAACMDKTYTRTVLGYNGFKTSNWRMMSRNDLPNLDEKCNEYCDELQFPIIVKPANFGSSAGIGMAVDFESLKYAVKMALTQDEKVVVEEFVEGEELQVAVIGYDNINVSAPGEVRIERDGADFNSGTENAEFIVPADLPDYTAAQISETAADVYRLMGCSGMARIDFYRNYEGEIIISQINPVPEISPDSMFVKLMEAEGYSFTELISLLLIQAIDDYDGKSVC